jgi:hypothetical protein
MQLGESGGVALGDGPPGVGVHDEPPAVAGESPRLDRRTVQVDPVTALDGYM